MRGQRKAEVGQINEHGIKPQLMLIKKNIKNRKAGEGY